MAKEIEIVKGNVLIRPPHSVLTEMSPLNIAIHNFKHAGAKLDKISNSYSELKNKMDDLLQEQEDAKIKYHQAKADMLKAIEESEECTSN